MNRTPNEKKHFYKGFILGFVLGFIPAILFVAYVL